jgi:NADH-quinone oxidoreductase subunit A
LTAAQSYAANLWPLLGYLGLAIVIVGGMLVLSFVLGQRHRTHASVEPYESGMLITGDARMRFDVKFYLIGMFFVVFDLESMFVFAWAIAARDVGWRGYVELLIFVAILLAALAYVWRLGGLDFMKRRLVED